MRDRRWIGGLTLAVFAAGLSGPALGHQAAPTAVEAPRSAARLGTIRVKIDPSVGEQEAEIRRLLEALPFIQYGEAADFLITTKPDFPLDVLLYDLRQPPDQWVRFDSDNMPKEKPEPRHYSIGFLGADGTGDRLAATLTAAARVRALLDRSLGDMQGVEACLVIVRQNGAQPSAPECHSLDADEAPKIVHEHEAKALMVRNGSTGDRYVSMVAADGNLGMGVYRQGSDPSVHKLAPGDSVEFVPRWAAGHFPAHPRVILLVSSHAFAVDDLTQPAPLKPTWGCSADPTMAECLPELSPIVLNDDVAVRSFQLIVPDEPLPAMGGGRDVTAMMAVWMAQFYSVIPYTPEEIAADRKLPGEKTQFLALRSYEERQHRCGATLIGPNLVLTAAHCVAKGQYAGEGLAKVMKQRRIRLGSRKLGEGGQSFAIAGVAVHPGYVADRQNHDIALLLLAADRGSGSAQPRSIAVAERPLPGGVKALGFGWGFTGAVGPNGNIIMAMDSRVQNNADVLQYGEMTSVTLDECRRKLADEVMPGMVCMYSQAALSGGQSADGVFICRGDSGGPLVRKVSGRDVLVGVVSWSKGCGYKDYPSVFTDAGSYAAWIAAARAELKPGAAIRPKDPARPAVGTSRN